MVDNKWIYDCEFGQEQFKRYMNAYLVKWLSSFNADSATECFTAVQELKRRVFNETKETS